MEPARPAHSLNLVRAARPGEPVRPGRSCAGAERAERERSAASLTPGGPQGREQRPSAGAGGVAARRQPRGLWPLGLAIGAGLLTGEPREPAADYVYLGRAVTASQRARQLRSVGAPPAQWTRDTFDDSAWAAVPVATQPPLPLPSWAASAGALWQTPAPPSAAPTPPAEPVLIFADDIAPSAAPPPAAPPTESAPKPAPPPPASAKPLPKPESGAATPPPPPPLSPGFATLGAFIVGAAAAAVAPLGPALVAVGVPVNGGGPGMAPDAPIFPSCSGALYTRRHFDLGAEAKQLSGLTLRIKYTDSFAAYLNGVEVARRRLVDAAQTVATTLAQDRGPVEPESFYLQIAPGQLRERDNLLAVEVHAKSVDRCAKADLELLGTTGPRVVRGPYIERLADGALDLTLETDQPAMVELRYGKGDVRSERDRRLAMSTLPQTSHRGRITGLRPGRVYHYQAALIGPGEARSELPLQVVHTPPPPGRPLRVVLYGDSRSGHAIHAQLVQAILDEDPDFVLNTGDLVERGTEEGDWDRFFSVAGPLIARVPVYLAAGNHEYARRRQGALRLFSLFSTMFPVQAPVRTPPLPSPRASLRPAPAAPVFAPHLLAETAVTEPLPALVPEVPSPLPAAPPKEPTLPGEPGEGLRGFYSLDVSGVHLVSIDSNQIHRREQLHWLATDLQAAQERRVRATLAWMHDGPFSMGYHGGNATAARELVPLLERYHVSLLVSGHDHDYERGRRGTLNYVVTGGGGAELRPLRCGIPGKRRCKNPPLAFFNEHHYVRLDVLPGALQLCPRRLDGSPLEECLTLRLPPH